MSSDFGKCIRLSIFGESHGEAIGVVLDGLPAGEPVDLAAIDVQLSRRAPGRDKSSTPRKERDAFRVLSGLFDGKTTGAPFCAIIENTNTKSGDYENLRRQPRPSHSDYAAFVKYGGHNDVRGGGHFSGRLTAPLVIAGALCRQMLGRRGITIGGHVLQIGAAADAPFDPVGVTAEELDALSQRYFSTRSPEAEAAMREEIEAARAALDSVGGMVEIAAVGLPAGLGFPMFRGVENVLSAALYGVPAIKAVSFGEGEGFAALHGSEANDQMHMQQGAVRTLTNHCGGITGGITNGMPLLVRAACKPTPSIARAQRTVDLVKQTDAVVEIHGRHDPCIVPRALPAAEAAVAVALADLMMEDGRL